MSATTAEVPVTDDAAPSRNRVVRWWQSLGSPRTRRVLLIILAVGGLLRVGWVAHAAVRPNFVSDPEAYLLQGKQIASGHGYTNPFVATDNYQRAFHGQPLIGEQPSSFYPPGYPTFIAGIAWIVWHTPIPDGDGGIVRTVAFVQVLLGVLSILLLYELARRVIGTRVALVAAAMMALYPGLVTLTATLQLETFFIALSLATMLVLLPLVTADEPRRGRLLLAGAFVGAVALVRPNVALLLVAFVITRLIARRPWRQTVAAALLLVAGMVALVIPWTIRNELTLHAFVPLSTGIGSALCMARNPDANGQIDAHILNKDCTPPTVASRTPAENDVETNRFATHEATHWIVNHPIGELRMWFWRTYYAYRKDTSGIDDFEPRMSKQWFAVLTTVSDSASFVVLALAVIGGVGLALTRRRGAVFLLASTVAYAVVPIVLFGDPRYRVPAEPLFMILAAVAVCAAIDGLRGRPERELSVSSS